MERRIGTLTDLLLQTSGTVVLHLDADDRLLQVEGGSAFAGWLPGSTEPQSGSSLSDVLRLLFDETQAGRILAQHHALRSGPAPATTTCPMIAARPLRLAATRWFDVTCARLAGGEHSALVLIIDRTGMQQLTDAAAAAAAAHDLALTVLRTDAAKLRQFLQTASSAISFIRSTLRQPARTQEALREKLALLRAEAFALCNAAGQLALRGIAAPCESLMTDLDALLAKDTLSGNDTLPLALRIDPISSAIGAAVTLDAQRPVSVQPSAQPAAPRAAAPRPVAAWNEICEQRTNDLIQKLSSRFGVLARMRMKGSALVPERYQRQIEVVLEPLLLNAIKHGIETPEQRLAVDKPAAGTVTITFRDRDAAGLEMIVHDDGRGFDLPRIESAALASGLIEPQSGAADPREVVGMIFKPGFTTTALTELPGEGRGMALLRETLHRQGGSVSVATKPLRYTQFTVRLPARESAAARLRPSRHPSAGVAASQP